MTLLQKIQNITWWTLDIKLKDILIDLFGRIETLEESGSVEEAPIDGTQYARQDGEWSEVTGDGGTQNLQSVLENGSSASITEGVDTFETYFTPNLIQISQGQQTDEENSSFGAFTVEIGKPEIIYQEIKEGVNYSTLINFKESFNLGTKIIYYPDKIAGDYTLATLDDLPQVANDFANDVAAAIGGIAVGELYHTAGVVKIRVS